jgi:hypothetical protein
VQLGQLTHGEWANQACTDATRERDELRAAMEARTQAIEDAPSDLRAGAERAEAEADALRRAERAAWRGRDQRRRRAGSGQGTTTDPPGGHGQARDHEGDMMSDGGEVPAYPYMADELWRSMAANEHERVGGSGVGGRVRGLMVLAGRDPAQ